MNSKGKKHLTRRQRNTIIIIFLMLPIIAGDIALIAKGNLPFIEMGIPFIISFAFISLLWYAIRHRDGQKIEGDERSIKIEGRAFAYSWYLSLYILVLLMINENLKLIRLSSNQCLFYILVVMLCSFLIIRTALNRKGDVED